jgi:hypothetical protein
MRLHRTREIGGHQNQQFDFVLDFAIASEECTEVRDIREPRQPDCFRLGTHLQQTRQCERFTRVEFNRRFYESASESRNAGSLQNHASAWVHFADRRTNFQPDSSIATDFGNEVQPRSKLAELDGDLPQTCRHENRKLTSRIEACRTTIDRDHGWIRKNFRQIVLLESTYQSKETVVPADNPEFDGLVARVDECTGCGSSANQAAGRLNQKVIPKVRLPVDA